MPVINAPMFEVIAQDTNHSVGNAMAYAAYMQLAPVIVATTAAITLSAAQTIDGVAVVAGDRVLVKNQSSAVDNGIYICNGSTWGRAPDMAAGVGNKNGQRVRVLQGTVNAGTEWTLSTADTITVGSSSLTFRGAVAVALTIASGVVTLPTNTGPVVVVTLTGEGGAADDLDTISGGYPGQIVILQSGDSGNDPTVKDGTNILAAGDFVLSNVADKWTGVCISSGVWHEIARADNA